LPVAEKSAYQLKGELLERGIVREQTETLSVEALKGASRRHDVTLRVYLTAAIAYAIHKESEALGSSPIAICVPVDLRPVFKIETASNFFSNIVMGIPHHCFDSFESTLRETKRQFIKNTTEKKFQEAILKTVWVEKNLLIRMIPLGMKDLGLKQVYRSVKRKRTTTFSNLGAITVEEPFKPFFKGFRVMVSTSPEEPLRITACSYNGELILACCSKLKDNSVMDRLLKILKDS